MSTVEPNTTTTSRLPHRLATLLVCAVFPLIWVGGLVTSSDAGMAVPDWPSTYGYNLFLYPWTTWFFGPWDIFVEHGHRLLGAAAGFITIALAWSLWRYETRTWIKWLGVAALAAVIGQGVLGGLRVVLDARLLAMTHACTGPLYFALCVAIWFYTKVDAASCRVSGSATTRQDAASTKVFRLALLTTCLANFQLVLGAVVRHMPVYAPPRTFHTAVMFHLFMAAVLTVHIVLSARAAFRTAELRRGGALLLSLIVVQLSLGAGTWIVNFGYPHWVGGVVNTPDFVVRTNSLPQLMVTTAHVAVGSLILVTSLVLTLKAKRFAGPALAAISYPVGLVLREALR
jgi:cytochrome c oxidase assembly protein subunit 15